MRDNYLIEVCKSVWEKKSRRRGITAQICFIRFNDSSDGGTQHKDMKHRNPCYLQLHRKAGYHERILRGLHQGTGKGQA